MASIAKKKTTPAKKKATPPRKSSVTGVKGPYEILTVGTDEVFVLGTAHISRSSVEDVEQAIAKWKPDVVCVELCRPRHEALLDPDRWKKMDLTKVIREKKLALLASNLILSSFQKKIGDQTGVRPGEEMRRASELAREKGLELVFIDREIRTTLSRAWAKVGFFSKMWLSSYLLTSLLVKEEVSAEEVEEMKQKDVLEDLFSNLPRQYQSVKEVILDERDAYLAENTRRVALSHAEVERHDHETKSSSKKKRRILSVVGAGHLPGILRTLKENRPVDLVELRTIPKPRPWRNLFIWIGASIFLFLVGLYITLGGQEAAEQALLAWVVARSAGAGIGAVLSGAHPLTILATVVMAPIVPLIPGSRLWMFSALVEVWRRKPRVEDFENIADDTETASGLFRSLYKNRVVHLFWVTFLVSMGLTIGNLEILRRILTGLFTQIGWM
ncbi:TraB/GumN family protein [Leptonema illini]|uniref:TraB family protein n=1 Tax=Leptonema illini DSM 21528 TaxID=929563 RepID=H2CLF1_9LEPT|nr:TraB/GumN family protein [Leptonema illini]EHQ04562.1 TraB family protein [Leptonema illini DSM 21528]